MSTVLPPDIPALTVNAWNRLHLTLFLRASRREHDPATPLGCVTYEALLEGFRRGRDSALPPPPTTLRLGDTQGRIARIFGEARLMQDAMVITGQADPEAPALLGAWQQTREPVYLDTDGRMRFVTTFLPGLTDPDGTVRALLHLPPFP